MKFNKKLISHLVFVLIITITVLNKEVHCAWHENSKSVHVTSQSFDSIVGQSKHIILNFFTPWCILCEKLNDDYNRLSDYFHENTETRKDVIIAKLNCQDEQIFCQQNHIHSFPTIKHFLNNQKTAANHFHGERKFETLRDWIEGVCGHQKKVEIKQILIEQQELQEADKKDSQVEKDILNDQQKNLKVLISEIKKYIDGGLTDVPTHLKNMDIKSFSELSMEDQLESVFDELHHIQREIISVKVINEERMKLFEKTIGFIDKMQDERIIMDKKIRQEAGIGLLKSNSSIFQNLLKNIQDAKKIKQNNVDVQTDFLGENHDLNKNKLNINWEHFAAFILIGLILGFLFTLLAIRIQRGNITNNSKMN